MSAEGAGTARSGTQIVLLTLAAGQFLMTLDSSVMNVSIATVAKDVGTTVTGIQGAITAYTLVMAALMITGGKIGGLIGRKRAFAIGCVIYGAGSLTTSLAPNLPVLLFGWSFLEGVGAALILPAIVALVAGNFPVERRPAAYGLVAAAGAVAVAVGPLIGGFATTYFSWRWVFAGEVVVVIAILLLTRRIADAPVETRPKFDLVGAVLSAAGLGAARLRDPPLRRVGLDPAARGRPVLGSPLADGVARARRPVRDLAFLHLGEPPRGQGPGAAHPSRHAQEHAAERRADHVLLPVPRSGRLLLRRPALPVGLPRPLRAGDRRAAAAALGHAAGRGDRDSALSSRTSRRGWSCGSACSACSPGRSCCSPPWTGTLAPEVVFVPMLLIGLGIGALASQLGAVTVSAVSDDQAPEVGGIQNTMTNLGASIGTALAGSILIASLSSAFLTNIEASSAIPSRAKSQAQVQLAGGVPFISDADLEDALASAHVSGRTTDAALGAYHDARITGLRSALAILGVMAILSLFFTRRIPVKQPGAS